MITSYDNNIEATHVVAQLPSISCIGETFMALTSFILVSQPLKKHPYSCVQNVDTSQRSNQNIWTTTLYLCFCLSVRWLKKF